MTFLIISEVISSDALDVLDAKLGALTWRDGGLTAGRVAKKVKRNEQADLKSEAGRAISKIVYAALKSNPVFTAAARPRRMSPIMISRTSNGGQYGAHVDNALMGRDDARLRTDMSFTLFLSAPETYEGGELIVHSAAARQSIKGDRGDLVLYPSSDIHEVAPVTRGARIACVGWVESLVADPAQRTLLFDLENLRASLRASLPDGSGELLTLDKTIANLLRMWASP